MTLRSWRVPDQGAEAKVVEFRILQWGHDLAVMESTGSCTRQLPRHVYEKLQWGHDLAVMESWAILPSGAALRTSFNGAMTLRSWRGLILEAGGSAFPRTTSMGP